MREEERKKQACMGPERKEYDFTESIDLFAVQRTHKSLLQHLSSKASILTLVEDQEKRPGIRYLGSKDNLLVKRSS